MRTEEIPGPDGATLRVRFIDVTLPEMPPHAPPVRFAVAADRGELKGELRPFNLALLWSMGALGLGLAVAVAIQVRVGLQPLRRVRIALADIRGGRTERIAVRAAFRTASVRIKLTSLTIGALSCS